MASVRSRPVSITCRGAPFSRGKRASSRIQAGVSTRLRPCRVSPSHEVYGLMITTRPGLPLCRPGKTGWPIVVEPRVQFGPFRVAVIAGPQPAGVGAARCGGAGRAVAPEFAVRGARGADAGNEWVSPALAPGGQDGDHRAHGIEPVPQHPVRWSERGGRCHAWQHITRSRICSMWTSSGVLVPDGDRVVTSPPEESSVQSSVSSRW